MPASASKERLETAALPEHVLRSHWQELRRWLMRRLRNPDAADDITQEVFLRLCCADNAQRIRDPLSYLFGIALNVLSAHRNAECRSNHVCFDSDEAHRAGESFENALDDESDLRIDIQRLLGEAYAKLPPPYQTVVFLCKGKGMTYEEAATASGLSIHTVEKYMVRARARLVAYLCDRF